MEIKSVGAIVIKIDREERSYQFVIPTNAPLGELYDVCHAVLQHVTKSAVDASERAKRDAQDATSIEGN